MSEIDRVLFDAPTIAAKVRELAARIESDHEAVRKGDADPLVVVGILKGAVLFTADLLRSLRLPVTLDFIAASSYGAATESTGVIRILKDLETTVTCRYVLLVEDIVDTGLTLRYLRDHVLAQGPIRVRICALLDKPSRRRVEVPVDYVGFVIPDEFVVGYGIDHAERHRNLPYIATIRPRA